ncbi:embryonic protein UVS.2-like [Ambystoma mexicanum]|uniref:embryonic protein UVS.2-like n=1 Tax=Ambystoma mexicanum TaxID=8296 RepID=UPI0037E8B97C
MDGRIWVFFAACLLSSCFALPVQMSAPERIFYELEKRYEQSVKHQNLDVFEIITKENEGSSQQMREGDIAMKPGRSAMVCTNNNCFWPKSSDGTVKVAYTLSSTYSSADVSAITDAMQEFSTLTCIRFVNRTTESNYLQIQSVDGCWSYVGKSGGGQAVSLSGGCLSKGTIQHELNHALGFYHEQSRSDRDNYVTIVTANISPGNGGNFNKENTNNLGLEYDFASVMHYGKYAFSSTYGQPTIIPKPNSDTPIGQRNGLSNLDVSKINTLYQCNVCSTLLSDTTGSLKSSNNPSAYPNNVNCIYLIRVPSDKVLLQFDAFDLQSSLNCVSDYVKIYDGDSKTAPVLLNKACGSGLPPPFTSSGNEMLVEFVTDDSITGSGFKASYSNVQCGNTFTSSPGTISSPFYPNVYHSNMDCDFYILAPVGYKVSLSFTTFNIEADATCAYDNLSIFNGAKTTSQRVGKYCGTNLVPPPVTSTGNSLLLQFHSDESLNLKGFQATYTFVKA